VNKLKILNEYKDKMIIYAIIVIVFFILLLPVYFSTLKLVKTNITDDITMSVASGFKQFDAEIDGIKNLCVKLNTNYDFLYIKKLEEISYQKDFVYIRNFSDFYKNVIGLNNIIIDSVVFLKKNHLAFSKEYIFDNPERDISELMSINDMSFEELKKFAFDHSDDQLMYLENFKNKYSSLPSILYITSMTQKLFKNEDAVMLNIIDMNRLLEVMGLLEIKNEIGLKFQDKTGNTVYADERWRPKTENITFQSLKTGLKVNVYIPNKYISDKMISVRMLILIYAVFAVLLSVVLLLFVIYVNSKPLKKLIKLTESITGIKYVEGNEYEYIKLSVSTLNSKIVRLRDKLVKNDYNKVLMSKLSEKEYAEILKEYPEFPMPCIIVIFSGEGIITEAIELLLKNCGINSGVITTTPDGNTVLILPYTDEPNYEQNIIDKMDKVVKQSNNFGFELNISISIPCEKIENLYHVYSNAVEMLRFIEHDHIISSKTFNVEYKPFVVNFEDSKRIYEYIIAGNAFEAKKSYTGSGTSCWRVRILTVGLNNCFICKTVLYPMLPLK